MLLRGGNPALRAPRSHFSRKKRGEPIRRTLPWQVLFFGFFNRRPSQRPAFQGLPQHRPSARNPCII